MITYKTLTDKVLGYELATEVSRVVNASFRDANRRYGTYSEEEVETFLHSYTPEAILQNPLWSMLRKMAS